LIWQSVLASSVRALTRDSFVVTHK
jgi:hypothetical protein